jgi:hypothetical protein
MRHALFAMLWAWGNFFNQSIALINQSLQGLNIALQFISPDILIFAPYTKPVYHVGLDKLHIEKEPLEYPPHIAVRLV